MARAILLEEDTFRFILEGGLAPCDDLRIEWGEPRLMEVEVWDPTIIVKYAPIADTSSVTEPASSSARPQAADTSTRAATSTEPTGKIKSHEWKYRDPEVPGQIGLMEMINEGSPVGVE